jgi:hypothetical protein
MWYAACCLAREAGLRVGETARSTGSATLTWSPGRSP